MRQLIVTRTTFLTSKYCSPNLWLQAEEPTAPFWEKNTISERWIFSESIMGNFHKMKEKIDSTFSHFMQGMKYSDQFAHPCMEWNYQWINEKCLFWLNISTTVGWPFTSETSYICKVRITHWKLNNLDLQKFLVPCTVFEIMIIKDEPMKNKLRSTK